MYVTYDEGLQNLSVTVNDLLAHCDIANFHRRTFQNTHIGLLLFGCIDIEQVVQVVQYMKISLHVV